MAVEGWGSSTCTTTTGNGASRTVRITLIVGLDRCRANRLVLRVGAPGSYGAALASQRSQ